MLGKGSFAEVRAAVHRIAKKNVAVKILKKTTMTEKQIERARCEIETLKMCQHPNIMRLNEIFESADYIYLVLEHLSGGNLFHHLQEKRFNIPEETAFRYVRSVSSALQYMHSFGIIHRDIKPDNIVLTSQIEGSDVKIVDFGLAKIFGPNELSDDSVGTLCYAAPEILLGKKYDNKVDVWSLGVLTYLLLVGQLPFNDMNSEKELAKYLTFIILSSKIVNKKLKFEEKRWLLVSPEGKDFVSSYLFNHHFLIGLLEKNPESRLSTQEIPEHPWYLAFKKKLDQQQAESNE